MNKLQDSINSIAENRLSKTEILENWKFEKTRWNDRIKLDKFKRYMFHETINSFKN